MNTTRHKTTSTRKPRPDKRLLKLPQDQIDTLAGWLISGMKYREAQQKVESEFGVKISLASLSNFWGKVCAPRLQPEAAASNILLDMVIECRKPQSIRLKILRMADGFAVVKSAFPPHLAKKLKGGPAEKHLN